MSALEDETVVEPGAAEQGTLNLLPCAVVPALGAEEVREEDRNVRMRIQGNDCMRIQAHQRAGTPSGTGVLGELMTHEGDSSMLLQGEPEGPVHPLGAGRAAPETRLEWLCSQEHW